MIADLKPYPAMKDSGVPWLGEVPEHWRVTALTGVGQLFKGKGGSKDDEVAIGVPCIRYGDLYTRHEFFIKAAKACVSHERAPAYTSLYQGDLLFAASGETIEDIGRSAVNLLETPALCGGDILLLRPKAAIDHRFLGYAADAYPARNQKASMGRGFTVVHIYASQLKRLALPLPPLPEQRAITRFLTHADRRIRRYIRAKQKLIKLLEEQKQAIIHRAVTRGLDPNVRLKPSGVEWLGDVPEHWEMRRLKSLVQRIDQGVSPLADNCLAGDTSWGVLKAGCVNRGVFREEEHKRLPTDYRVNQELAIAEGDVLVSRASGSPHLVGSVGRVTSLRYRLILSDKTFRLQFNDSVCPDFMVLVGNGRYYRQQVEQAISGAEGLANNLPLSSLRDFFFAVPRDVSEQRAIVHAVHEATSALQDAIITAGQQVSLLQELRTRLIADVVTGKLDVREAAARLPDEPDDLGELGEASESDEPELLDDIEADGDTDETGAEDTDAVPEEAEP